MKTQTVGPPTRPVEIKLRLYSCGYLCVVEVAIYSLLGLMLAATGLLVLSGVGKLFWDGVREWPVASRTFQIMDRLLVVLMLVEILHTVRISIKSQVLVTEPFLIVGLIASIRRMLVITLEAANLTQPERWAAGGESIFRASMYELALLAVTILILVISIHVLLRGRAQEEAQGVDSANDQGSPGGRQTPE